MVDLPFPAVRPTQAARAPGTGAPAYDVVVVADPHAPWQEAIGRDDAGLPVHVRWDPVAVAVAPVPGFDIQLGVTVPLRVAGEDGLPSPAEEQRLAAVEAQLRAGMEAGDRARLVLVVTTRGLREYVGYAEDDAWVADWAAAVRAASPDAQVMTQLDSSWNTLRYFTP
jgi:hypothetical protein